MSSNNVDTKNNNITKRKKNPRDMTIEELEEYIQKNKNKNYNPYNTESRSLNSSFTSNNHFGLFNEKFKENFDNNSNKSFHQKNFSVGKNINIQNEEVLNKENKDVNVNNITNNNNLDNQNNNKFTLIENIVQNSPFIKSNSSSKNNTLNTISKEEENLNKNQNNFNYQNNNNLNNNNFTNPLNNSAQKPFNSFNFYSNIINKQNEFNNTNNNNLNSYNSNNTQSTINNSENNNLNTNSKAINDYIKSLQEKIKFLENENEELKKNYFKISARYDTERTLNLNKTNSNNNENELIKKNSEFQIQLNLCQKNISMLEIEKNRHLEQNAIDKENFMNEIEKLKNINNELNEKYNNKCEEFDKIRAQYENERNEMIESLTSLREIIFQKDNENNNVINQYEKIIQEKNKKIENLIKKNNNTTTNLKQSMSSSVSSNFNNNNNKVVRQKSLKKINLNKNINNQSSLKNSNGHNNNNKKLNTKNNNNNKNRNKTPIKNNKKPKTSIKKTSNNDNINLNKENKNELESLMNIKEMDPNQNYLNNIILGDITSLRSDYSELNGNINYNYFNNNNNYNIKEDNNNIEQLKINQQNKNELNLINENIFNLERTIPELSRDYKNILYRLNSNLFPDENENLKKNLEIIGTDIENKNIELNKLKNKQQQLLKILTLSGNIN